MRQILEKLSFPSNIINRTRIRREDASSGDGGRCHAPKWEPPHRAKWASEA
jgi:hypothetical protein